MIIADENVGQELIDHILNTGYEKIRIRKI